MTPDLIIFDCDGVLIDSEIIACTVDTEALNQIGYTISLDEVVRRFAGVPVPEVYAEIERDLGRPLPEDFARRTEERVLQSYRTELKAIPGAGDVIGKLRWPYCVASSSKASKLGLGLIESGLFDFFYPHIYSVDLVEKGKPSPDIFYYAAKQMGVEAERCVVVEDSLAGVTAARRAGMRVLGFTGGSHCQGNHSGALRGAGAEVVFDQLDLLERIVMDLPEAPDRESAVPSLAHKR